jgi:hypothetical protein
MQDTVGARNVETKTKAFISYSRKDMAFVDRLEAALKARGFEVLIDREEIYAFEDWWKRIQSLIGRSDTIIFVLSPAAVASRVALREVQYAASLNKRFAPIVCRGVDDSAVPEALRRLNFIFFDDPSLFEAGADKLAKALQTDIGWIRRHTEFGEAARRWTEGGRASGLLLHRSSRSMDGISTGRRAVADGRNGSIHCSEPKSRGRGKASESHPERRSLHNASRHHPWPCRLDQSGVHRG